MSVCKKMLSVENMCNKREAGITSMYSKTSQRKCQCGYVVSELGRYRPRIDKESLVQPRLHSEFVARLDYMRYCLKTNNQQEGQYDQPRVSNIVQSEVESSSCQPLQTRGRIGISSQGRGKTRRRVSEEEYDFISSAQSGGSVESG